MRLKAGLEQGCFIRRPATPQLCRNRPCKECCAAALVLSGAGSAANHEPTSAAARSRAFRRADALSRQTEAEDERRARLAAALRENLKRRKAQARARRASDTAVEDTPPPAKAEPPRS